MMSITALALVGMFAYDQTRPPLADGDVRSWSTLYFCTEDVGKGCDPAVMQLDYTLYTRQAFFKVARGFPADEAMDVLLQDVTVKFLNPIDDTKTPGDQIFIFLDTDGDGRFDATRDERLASATVRGKRIKFENLNLRFSESQIPEEGLMLGKDLFIAGGGLAELVSGNTIDGVTVEAQNLLKERGLVMDVASFVDQTMFAFADEVVESRDTFLSYHPEFTAGTAANEIVLPPGTYEIVATMIVPEGLTGSISPGTHILLGPGVSFVSYSPLQMIGTPSQPITITAGSADEPYGAFAMVGAIGNSDTVRVSNLNVSGGSEATVNGAFLSGMFSIYRFGRTEVTDSVFRGAAADDALNIKYSEVFVNGNHFFDNSADAIDGDFVAGELSHNFFSGNGNDALDFSGSNVDVAYNNVQSSGDKCVSVGENTDARIKRNVFYDCEIGIEVKDASDAIITENLITRSRTWAVHSYVKKAFFGPATLAAFDNVLLENADLFGDMAADFVADGSNTTTGDLSVLERELAWLAETQSAVPGR